MFECAGVQALSHANIGSRPAGIANEYVRLYAPGPLAIFGLDLLA